ncbi:MAG: PAS domain S-box protein, partial [candidate division Zixibacteria bacterium]|nr:PAS domain S-box protein [candidate division Zixibacteria bacterium]
MSKNMKKKASLKTPASTRVPGNAHSVSNLIRYYKQARIPESDRRGICLLDGDSLRIVKSNRLIRSVFCMRKDDFEGRKFPDLFYFSDRPRLESALKECLDHDRMIDLDGIFLRSDKKRPARLELNLQVRTHAGKSCIQVALRKHLMVEEVSSNGSDSIKSGDAVALLSPMKLIDCNREFLSLFGRKSTRIPDRRLTAFFSMESRRKIKALFNGSCKDGVPLELEGMHNSGDLLYFEAIPETIPCNRRTLLRLRMRDLTSHKKTEHELIRSRARFHSLLENVHYGFFIIDLESSRIVFMNNYGRALVGKTKIPLEKLNPLQFLLPERLPKIQAIFNRFTDGSLKEYRSEEELKLPDGRRIHIEYESHYIEYQGNACIQGIFQDISSRVEAKRALQENEERFRQMAENIREIFWIVERNPTRTIYVSPVYEEIIGLPLEDVYHDHDDYLKLVHPDDYEKVSARFDKADIETDTEYRIVRPDGSIRWLRSRSFPIFDDKGEVYRTAGIVRDITERKLTEQALKSSEHKYRGLYENLTDGFAASDLKGNIVEFNRAFELMTGYSPAELKRLHFNDLTPEKWHPMETRIMREEALVKGYSKVYEKEYRRKDGALVPVEMRAHLLRDIEGDPVGYWAIIRDITDRKKTDKTIRESEQKYRSVVDNVGIGISLISPEMRILSLNNQMKKWFPHIDETKRPLCYRQFQKPLRNKICPFCPTSKTFED